MIPHLCNNRVTYMVYKHTYVIYKHTYETYKFDN